MKNWDEIARVAGYESDRDLITDLYYRQNLSDTDICDRLGISRGAFYNRLRHLNLPRKGKIPAKYVAGPKCPKCGSDKARIIYAKGYSYGFRRIKVCKECQNKFVTIERIDD